MNKVTSEHGKRRRAIAGFNLVEVIVAIFILGCMALMFAAVVPSSLRSLKSANYYDIAAQVAQRKLDQLMDPSVGYYRMTPAGLKGTVLSDSTTGGNLASCEWYDPAPTSVGTLPNKTAGSKTFVKKDYRLVGYFTKIDGLRKFYDDGTDACRARLVENGFPGDSDVMGRMDIEGWQPNATGLNDTPLMKVTITITWHQHGQGKSTYTTSTLIPENTIL